MFLFNYLLLATSILLFITYGQNYATHGEMVGFSESQQKLVIK